MKYVKDFNWKKGMSVKSFVEELGGIGFQAIELKAASEIIEKMKSSKSTGV